MSEFENRVVIVTGAGRGIGREIAAAFASQGAIIAANDISPVNLDETVARIKASGGQTKDYIFDIAKKMPVQALVNQVLEDWGRVDILINNAGVQPHASILTLDEWDWQRSLDVNLSGPFFLMQAVGRIMKEQEEGQPGGRGVIVNVASIAGRAHGLKDRAAYVASKMGLIGLTREAAREFAAYGIRVNAVCPGVIETEMTSFLRQDEDRMSEWLQEIPQGRLGCAEDIAGMVLFLCSRAARYVTGQAINVDGGMVMS